MQRLSLRFYEDKQAGQFMSNMVNDTDLFEQLISQALPDVVAHAITLAGVTAVLVCLKCDTSYRRECDCVGMGSAKHCARFFRRGLEVTFLRLPRPTRLGWAR